MDLIEQRRARALYMKSYNRTLRGFIKTKWAKMVQRVRGHNGHEHIYAGLEIADKQDFYKWAFSDKKIAGMFGRYRRSGWKYSLCPSVDRIDSSRGYVIGNMRFITMKENRDMGRYASALSRKSRTACHRGHEYSQNNTYIRSNGGRDCRACSAEKMRRRRAALQ